LRQELRTYIAEGASKQELKNSISNITGSFPLNLDSNNKLLGYLAMIGFYNLPENYLDTFLDNVRAVTNASAKQAFASMINPDRMITVVVGRQNDTVVPAVSSNQQAE
jgi:zinc protease